MNPKFTKDKAIAVGNERLATLETKMEHTQHDVNGIKSDIREIKESSKNVEIAVVELAEIARTNQRLYPRLEALERLQDNNPRLRKLEEKVESLTVKLAYWGGGLAVIAFVASFVGSALKKLLLG